jgi:AraC-like DNA-binding protein
LIPPLGQTSLNFSSFIILLGVVQGILLTITWLFKPQFKAKLRGLLFLSITCIIAEIFLNRTGYMYYVIQLVDFSEPIQFAIPPLIYLCVISLNPEGSRKKWGLHFIPFAAYLLYFVPYYLAPVSFKSESYYYIHHLVEWQATADNDFYFSWGKLRMFQMDACYLQATIYLVLCFQKLLRYNNKSLEYPSIDQSEVKWWLVFNATFAMLIVVIVVVKVTFTRDLGDHIIASFYTLILYIGTLTELIRPSKLQPVLQPITVENETPRYVYSGIKEEKKVEIRQKLVAIMEQKKLYTDSLLSLAKVAKQVGEPAYMVSQVINEKMEATFYDWIAKYRVEEAKRLLSDPITRSYTIEQIAEEVGYNSKSAFNKAFKKFSGKTPSEFKIS